jgi:hypothetical protein
MDLNTKLAVLEEIYKIYDRFSADLDIACQKYCAQCCTCNVTITTLEGYKIANDFGANEITDFSARLETVASQKRFQPQITTNRLAELCMQGEDLPTEECDSRWGSCPLLTDSECPIYSVRPFGCRCLVSNQPCREKGYAEVDPFVITVNDVLLQYIEHIDSQGATGNLNDVLRFMAVEKNRQAYRQNQMNITHYNLIPNRPLNVLMIPPEHRNRIKPILKSVQNIKIPRNQAQF